MPHVLAQDLRLAVFQTAFSGGLTERCNEDSSVDEYLNDCRDKRLEYEKKYKEKKHKSLWETGDYETPFDIPDEWRWAYVGDIFRHNAGKALNAKNTAGIKRKYLTTSNVYTDHFELDNLREMYYTDDEVEKCSVQKGDLLVLEGGDCGRTALWDLDESYCIQNHLHRLRLFGEGNIKYFFYLLSFYKDAGYTKGKGIAIQGLSANALHNIVIPIPPIEEQGRIVAKIDELMAKIDEYEKIETQLTELKKAFPGNMKDAILQAAMQGKLTEQLESDGDVYEYLDDIASLKASLIQEKKLKKDKTTDIVEDEYPFDIPDSWAWTKFGAIANLRPGKTPPRAEPTWWGDKNDVPWVSIADMIADGHVSKTKEFISQAGFKEKFKESISPAGTMIMSFKLTVGRVSYLDIDALHNEAIISIFPFKDDNNILQSYLFMVLPYLTKYGDSKNAIKGTTLNEDSLCNLYIPLPPFKEQQRIVDKLDQLLPLCEQLEKMAA